MKFSDARGLVRARALVFPGAGFAGLVALGLGLVALAATGPAFADDSLDGGRGGGMAADPTVGTLPMVGGPAGFDQALTLRGDSEAVRRALRSAVALDGADVETTFEVTSLGGEQVWMRFYGDVRLELDLDALTQVELGVFSGFEGYGMGVVVESASGQSPVYSIEAGHELILDPLRLVFAGVLERPLLVHGAHRSGELTGVALTYEPSSGALVLHQDI